MFFHGTTAELAEGDLLDPAQTHDRVHPVSFPDRICFTTDPVRASFYADLAARKHGGERRVYKVEPTGQYWQDMQTRHSPENKVTPHPLRVLGEVPYTDWEATHYVR